MKNFIRSILKNAFFWQQNKSVIYVFIDKNKIDEYSDHLERCKFYLKDAYKIVKYDGPSGLYTKLFANGPYRVLFTTDGVHKLVLNNYFLNVDYNNNPNDGWAWHHAINLLSKVSDAEIEISHQRLIAYHKSLPQFKESLVMGTGQSLVKARKLTQLECYKIACNTIVKDHKLWKDLKPHFLVAGDAIYHFGHNLHATSFRNDLKLCLREHKTLFLYPALYHPFVRDEFKEFKDLLVPIPNDDTQILNNNLLHNFNLPALGNVLNLLLLPLATSISKKIYLLGFDGRQPSDKLFWTNSSDHSYTEYIPDIQKKHPKFFDYFIDDKNPFKYVNAVHGDSLDNNLTALEKSGYEFIVLAPSHTGTMQKRFKPLFNLD